MLKNIEINKAHNCAVKGSKKINNEIVLKLDNVRKIICYRECVFMISKTNFKNQKFESISSSTWESCALILKCDICK